MHSHTGGVSGILGMFLLLLVPCCNVCRACQSTTRTKYSEWYKCHAFPRPGNKCEWYPLSHQRRAVAEGVGGGHGTRGQQALNMNGSSALLPRATVVHVHDVWGLRVILFVKAWQHVRYQVTVLRVTPCCRQQLLLPKTLCTPWHGAQAADAMHVVTTPRGLVCVGACRTAFDRHCGGLPTWVCC